MKLLDVFRKKTKKNEKTVIVKSKFGLPTFRVCGVQLVDAGPGCPFQGQAIVKNIPEEEIQNNNETKSFLNSNLNESLSDVVFQIENQNIKLLFIDHFGVIDITFGQGETTGGAVEYLQIQYDPKQTSLESLILIYNNQSNQSKKRLLYRNKNQKIAYITALRSVGVQIETSQIN